MNPRQTVLILGMLACWVVVGCASTGQGDVATTQFPPLEIGKTYWVTVPDYAVGEVVLLAVEGDWIKVQSSRDPRGTPSKKVVWFPKSQVKAISLED